MPTLYVASTETFVGKSAVCMTLLNRMRHDGFTIGYMKPVSVTLLHGASSVIDEDARLIHESLGLDTSLEQTAPVLITRSVTDEILRSEAPAFGERLQAAYAATAQSKDVVVLEGSNSWDEGALVNLTADVIIDMFNATGLLVSRYESTHTIDTILSVRRYIGDRLTGVLINQVETPQLEFVQQRVAPFLESRGIPVLGILPRERFLASVTVHELLEHLGGQLVGSRDWCEKRIESLMVGAMGAEASLSHFRRRPNKAVITGGDRIDVQMVALETSTNALVLSGNLRPPLNVLDRAEERRVPIIIVPDDTLTTVERAEELFGRIRFHQHAKFERFTRLMNDHFDYQRLYAALGVAKRQV